MVVAVAEFPGPLNVAVTGDVVFTCCPSAIPVTFTEKVHEPDGPIMASDRLMVDVP